MAWVMVSQLRKAFRRDSSSTLTTYKRTVCVVIPQRSSSEGHKAYCRRRGRSGHYEAESQWILHRGCECPSYRNSVIANERKEQQPADQSLSKCTLLHAKHFLQVSDVSYISQIHRYSQSLFLSYH